MFLLVEDDPNDAWMVEREFKKAPHLRIRHVPDGVEAMRYLRGEGKYADRHQYPLPNVILLDLKMPGVSGFEVLKWLHSEAAGDLRLIPVVVMSSSMMEEDVHKAYELGVNAYLYKPIDWSTFRERIRMLGIYWSQNVETPKVHGDRPHKR